jgi:isopenicillin N synthase-like dioxygenase
MLDVVPVIDYGVLGTDRHRFVRSCAAALRDIGFMILSNVDGLDAAFQQQCFEVSHAFFALTERQKQRYAVVKSPHFRGWARPGLPGLSPHIIEAFQLGLDQAPVARHDDMSQPLWRRISRGPNVWPSEADAPGFRATIERLHSRYFELSREIGHVLCEALHIDSSAYEAFFDGNNPDALAAINHNFPLAGIANGVVRKQVAAAFQTGNGEQGMGAHVDGAPFVTLLIADSPGLQVLAMDGETWLNVPVVPGGVVVNIGATLMKLSGKRLRATTHRVNPLVMTDDAAGRCSLPYFLMPKLEGPLVPFGQRPSDDRTYRDRGLAYTVDRARLFSDSAERWYPGEAEAANVRLQREYNAYMKKRQARL